MGLIEILNGVLLESIPIDSKILPSQGIFYQDDFSLRIQKASIEDINQYESNFDKNDFLKSFDCIKQVVKKNTLVSEGYDFLDIKSIDIIFIFLEIVKYTTKKDIRVSFFNKNGNLDFIKFSSENFNYFNFKKYNDFYNSKTKEIIIDGYKFSLPSIGVESSLSKYIMTRTSEDEIKMLSKASFDFVFFLTGKRYLNDHEIKNLVQIFNFDMDEEQKKKIKSITDNFKDIISFSLISDDSIVEIKSKINMEHIWKM